MNLKKPKTENSAEPHRNIDKILNKDDEPQNFSQSFEDMMSKYKVTSDERISMLKKKNIIPKRGGSRRG